MKERLTRWLPALLFVFVAAFASQLLAAETQFPTRPVRMIVPFPPGQATDIIARLLAERLTDRWKQRVVVEDISGGNSVPGTVAGRNARPDGYTITFVTSSTLAVNPSILPDLAYDPKRDFVMVNAVFISPWVVVANGNAPFNTLQEMIDAAKAKPGSLMWGLGASALQMGGELFKLQTGVDIINVPYKGSAPAINDLLGGQIPILIDTAAATLPYIKANKIKVLATLSAERAPWLPDVPTAVELGYAGLVAAGWGGVAVPAGTPNDVVTQIGSDVRHVLSDPVLQQKISTLGAVVDARGPEEWTKFVNAELAKWDGVATRAHMKPH